MIRTLTKFFFRKKYIKPSPTDPLRKPKDAAKEISTSEVPNEPIDILKIAQDEPIIKPRTIYEIHNLFLHWWRDLDDYKKLKPVDDKIEKLSDKADDLSIENLEFYNDEPNNIEELDLDLEDLTGECLNYCESSIPESGDSFIEPGDWLIGMSLEFTKSIKKVDKKLKGRILDAISNLSKVPNKTQGKTIKPLSANLKGLWSCKIGQSHRLIYKPDTKKKTVILMAYMPRESDYKPHRI